jgi:hypothetical protein
LLIFQTKDTSSFHFDFKLYIQLLIFKAHEDESSFLSDLIIINGVAAEEMNYKQHHSLRMHEERPLHMFDIVETLIKLDFAASSNGSESSAFSKQYLASSNRPSATKTRPRLLNAGA